jgi:hypothetical protein
MISTRVVSWSVLALALSPALARGADPGETLPRSTVINYDEALGLYQVDFKAVVPRSRVDGLFQDIQPDKAGGGLLHRILVDSKRGLYYGYDLQIAKGEASGRFVITVRPLSAKKDLELREDLWKNYCPGCAPPRALASTSQRFPGPQTVGWGDTVTLDLLADERSHEVISEQITLSLPDASPKPPRLSPPRDFKAEEVWLQMAEPRLLVNGREVWAESGAVQGDVIWTELPDRGRALFSLTPRPGYEFKKVGVVSGKTVSFTIGDDRYEWVSKGAVATPEPAPPINRAQSWNLWVLHDAGFPASGVEHGTSGGGLDARLRTDR